MFPGLLFSCFMILKTLIEHHQSQNIKTFYYIIGLITYLYVWVISSLLKEFYENANINASK